MDDAQRRAWAALDLGPVWAERARGVTMVEPVLAAGDPPVAQATVTPLDQSAKPGALDWAALRETVTSCERCTLCASRTQTVFGVGDIEARWLFVGEAPGAEEDLRGEPFVGQAGMLLDAMLASLGLDRRRDVYIANVLKCRPPANRNPAPEEVAQCEPYLLRQIALVRPQVIVAMGRFAVQSLLGTDAGIASLRGQVHPFRLEGLEVPLVVTYHPAYLLRSLAEKSKAWADLCLARSLVSGATGTP